MKKKRAFTLLEIMIVIFLIGLIGSIIGYNMKGSLEEGKAFKTKQSMRKLIDILEMEIAKGADVEQMQENVEPFLERSGLVKKAKVLTKDGWGKPFVITIHDDGTVSVFSAQYNGYKRKKNNIAKYEDEE